MSAYYGKIENAVRVLQAAIIRRHSRHIEHLCYPYEVEGSAYKSFDAAEQAAVEQLTRLHAIARFVEPTERIEEME